MSGWEAWLQGTLLKETNEQKERKKNEYHNKSHMEVMGAAEVIVFRSKL